MIYECGPLKSLICIPLMGIHYRLTALARTVVLHWITAGFSIVATFASIFSANCRHPSPRSSRF